MDLQTTLTSASLVLTECAIAERLRRAGEVELHPTLFNTPLIYDARGREKLAAIYRQYREIAARAGLPILLCAPTWRIDQVRIAEAGFDKSLLFDAVSFMRNLQQQWQAPDSEVFIGGLIGPKNDCYKTEQALDAEAAQVFHQWQIEQLTIAGVDCIIAQTIPAVSEALGMARALARSGIPAIISFVINRKAEVLDGTPLIDAINTLDDSLVTPPLGYMVNCVYPTFVCAETQPPALFNRLLGIQANSSSLDHSQLDGAAILHQDDLQHWGDNMLRLNREFGVKILGGCCGTDNTYLQYLVDHRQQ
ncbi:homocysteine S-methyltransferase family protein [Desulfopila sp. IMCC35006]|uniref:homocysteine S-methyltransferase family protein n=1 Tax=Desulfopila sp. IMCC35006 TaxID=2569542 RepID=UPI0010AC0BFA|nr:homocysteine S-methyltransferase family protein [Desulfopila sp. IMCC35006]TKB25115.1 homocysteine S-methyltransferase family protein [Desulfopila sp. IMCC35006]